MRVKRKLTVSQLLNNYDLATVYVNETDRGNIARFRDTLYSQIPADLVIEVWEDVPPELDNTIVVTVGGKSYKLVPE